jgi:hypothetical protein
MPRSFIDAPPKTKQPMPKVPQSRGPVVRPAHIPPTPHIAAPRIPTGGGGGGGGGGPGSRGPQGPRLAAGMGLRGPGLPRGPAGGPMGPEGPSTSSAAPSPSPDDAETPNGGSGVGFKRGGAVHASRYPDQVRALAKTSHEKDTKQEKRKTHKELTATPHFRRGDQ